VPRRITLKLNVAKIASGKGVVLPEMLNTAEPPPPPPEIPTTQDILKEEESYTEKSDQTVEVLDIPIVKRGRGRPRKSVCYMANIHIYGYALIDSIG
jgi:hypothetical protein